MASTNYEWLSAVWGISKEQVERAEANGIKLRTLKQRIRARGMSVEEAINEPLNFTKSGKGTPKPTKYLTTEQYQTAVDNNIPLNLVALRIRSGWTVEQAITAPKMAIRQPSKRHLVTSEHLETARQNGLHDELVYARIKKGATVEDAITKPYYFNRKEQ